MLLSLETLTLYQIYNIYLNISVKTVNLFFLFMFFFLDATLIHILWNPCFLICYCCFLIYLSLLVYRFFIYLLHLKFVLHFDLLIFNYWILYSLIINSFYHYIWLIIYYCNSYIILNIYLLLSSILYCYLSIY